MSFKYKIHSLAYQENIESYQWYELQQNGLGFRYLTAVEKTIDQIIKNPEHYSILRGKYRHAKVREFPFSIVYEFSQQRKASIFLQYFMQAEIQEKNSEKKNDLILFPNGSTYWPCTTRHWLFRILKGSDESLNLFFYIYA